MRLRRLLTREITQKNLLSLIFQSDSKLVLALPILFGIQLGLQFLQERESIIRLIL